MNHVIGLGLKNPYEQSARYHLAILCVRVRGFAQAKGQLEAILRDFPAEGAAVPRNYVYKQLSITYRCLGDEAMTRIYVDLAGK